MTPLTLPKQARACARSAGAMRGFRFSQVLVPWW
jgi:hypothetical protein